MQWKLLAFAMVGSVACTFGSNEGAGGGSGNDDDDATTSGTTPAETTSTSGSDTIPFDSGSSDDDDDDDDDDNATDEDTGPTNCPEDWWDDAWSTRVRVEIDNGGRTAKGIPLPLILDLTGKQLQGAAMGGADLRFIADDGTELSYELTRGNDQTAIAWILHEHIGSDVDGLWLYLGNPQAERADDPNAVWFDYEGVWHFDVADDAIVDSAADLHGKPMGVAPTPGPAGAAQTFGSDASIDFGDASDALFSGWPTMTLSLWLYFDYPDDGAWEAAGEDHVVRRNGPVRFGRTWRPQGLDPGMGFFQIDIENEDETVYRRFQTTREQWHWFVYDYDGDSLRLFLDGEEYEDHSMPPGPLVMDETALRLGEGDAFEGAADELWIGNATHGEDWYGLQYSAMQGGVFTLGDAEGC